MSVSSSSISSSFASIDEDENLVTQARDYVEGPLRKPKKLPIHVKRDSLYRKITDHCNHLDGVVDTIIWNVQQDPKSVLKFLQLFLEILDIQYDLVEGNCDDFYRVVPLLDTLCRNQYNEDDLLFGPSRDAVALQNVVFTFLWKYVKRIPETDSLFTMYKFFSALANSKIDVVKATAYFIAVKFCKCLVLLRTIREHDGHDVQPLERIIEVSLNLIEDGCNVPDVNLLIADTFLKELALCIKHAPSIFADYQRMSFIANTLLTDSNDLIFANGLKALAFIFHPRMFPLVADDQVDMLIEMASKAMDAEQDCVGLAVTHFFMQADAYRPERIPIEVIRHFFDMTFDRIGVRAERAAKFLVVKYKSRDALQTLKTFHGFFEATKASNTLENKYSSFAEAMYGKANFVDTEILTALILQQNAALTKSANLFACKLLYQLLHIEITGKAETSRAPSNLKPLNRNDRRRACGILFKHLIALLECYERNTQFGCMEMLLKAFDLFVQYDDDLKNKAMFAEFFADCLDKCLEIFRKPFQPTFPASLREVIAAIFAHSLSKGLPGAKEAVDSLIGDVNFGGDFTGWAQRNLSITGANQENFACLIAFRTRHQQLQCLLQYFYYKFIDKEHFVVPFIQIRDAYCQNLEFELETNLAFIMACSKTARTLPASEVAAAADRLAAANEDFLRDLWEIFQKKTSFQMKIVAIFNKYMVLLRVLPKVLGFVTEEQLLLLFQTKRQMVSEFCLFFATKCLDKKRKYSISMEEKCELITSLDWFYTEKIISAADYSTVVMRIMLYPATGWHGMNLLENLSRASPDDFVDLFTEIFLNSVRYAGTSDVNFLNVIRQLHRMSTSIQIYKLLHKLSGIIRDNEGFHPLIGLVKSLLLDHPGLLKKFLKLVRRDV